MLYSCPVLRYSFSDPKARPPPASPSAAAQSSTSQKEERSEESLSPKHVKRQLWRNESEFKDEKQKSGGEKRTIRDEDLLRQDVPDIYRFLKWGFGEKTGRYSDIQEE